MVMHICMADNIPLACDMEPNWSAKGTKGLEQSQ